MVRAPSFGLTLRKAHLLEQPAPPLIVVQAAQEAIDLHRREPRIVLPVRAPQPLEGTIGIASHRVQLCELIGGDVAMMPGQLIERRGRRGGMPQREFAVIDGALILSGAR